MELFDYQQPEFLFCEIPIKDGTQNDDRIWIYHRLSLSLIEFINTDKMLEHHFSADHAKETFYHNSEAWLGVFVQNNCDLTENSQETVIQNAWKFLKEYLEWEDKNINEGDKSRFN